MNIIQWYVGFHPRGKGWRRLGHVEIWGYTEDDTWVFFDLTVKRIGIRVTHHFDEIERELSLRMSICEEIWKVSAGRELTFPVVSPVYCIPFVGHVLGIRAFTFGGLKRKLAAMNAELWYVPGCPTGRPTGKA